VNVAHSRPAISLVIPHFNRREYLAAVLASAFSQDFREFEVVVADDASTDDSADVIPALLADSGLRTEYIRHATNVGFGENLKSALLASTGEYVLLLGNDDALLDEHILGLLREDLERLSRPEVSFTNAISDSDFRYDTTSPTLYRRALDTSVLGTGPNVAISNLRSTSFVGGLIFERRAMRQAVASVPRATLFFQSALMASIVANGGRLAAISRPAVIQSIRVDGALAPSYSPPGSPEPVEPEGTNAALLEALWLGLTTAIPVDDASRGVRKAYTDIAFFAVLPAVLLNRRAATGSSQRRRRLLAGIDPRWIEEFVGDESFSLRSAWTRMIYRFACGLGRTLPSSAMRLQAPLAAAVRRLRTRQRGRG
jgi:glycosyltransferase involved in cell wall biosynthesis